VVAASKAENSRFLMGFSFESSGIGWQEVLEA